MATYVRCCHKYISMSHAVIICYSITKRTSFLNALNKWYDMIKEKNSTVEIFLVGTRLDVEKKAHFVYFSEAQITSKQKNLEFFETSSLQNENINELLFHMTNKLYYKLVLKKSLNLDWERKLQLDPSLDIVAKKQVLIVKEPPKIDLSKYDFPDDEENYETENKKYVEKYEYHHDTDDEDDDEDSLNKAIKKKKYTAFINKEEEDEKKDLKIGSIGNKINNNEKLYYKYNEMNNALEKMFTRKRIEDSDEEEDEKEEEEERFKKYKKEEGVIGMKETYIGLFGINFDTITLNEDVTRRFMNYNYTLQKEQEKSDTSSEDEMDKIFKNIKKKEKKVILNSVDREKKHTNLQEIVNDDWTQTVGVIHNNLKYFGHNTPRTQRNENLNNDLTYYDSFEDGLDIPNKIKLKSISKKDLNEIHHNIIYDSESDSDDIEKKIPLKINSHYDSDEDEYKKPLKKKKDFIEENDKMKLEEKEKNQIENIENKIPIMEERKSFNLGAWILSNNKK
jgi:hypothetical protein